MISTILPFWSQIHSSVSSDLLWTLSSVVFMSVVTVFSSNRFFFLHFLPLYWCLPEFILLICRDWWSSLWLLLGMLSLVDSLPPFHLVLFLGFCLFFVWNIFLCVPIWLVCFYVLGRSFMSPDLDKVALFWRYPLWPGAPEGFTGWTSVASCCGWPTMAMDTPAGNSGAWPSWLCGLTTTIVGTLVCRTGVPLVWVAARLQLDCGRHTAVYQLTPPTRCGRARAALEGCQPGWILREMPRWGEQC